MEQGTTMSQDPTPAIPDIVSPELLQMLRDHGVIKAELFGSFAAGTDGPDSDLDLLVAFGRPVTLFQRLDLAEELSRQCGRKVDVLTAIDPAFLPYIQPTLIALPL
jgi:predicted nucleotidyltransferase